MSFETEARVRFAHVDAAGIVFYPRYFEMLNAAVEDWFDQSLGLSFRQMHLETGIGTPTVKLEVTFLSTSRLGDDLVIRITPRAVGQSSCTIEVLFTAKGQDRLRAHVVLVCMDLDSQRSTPWPDDVRARMQAQLEPCAA